VNTSELLLLAARVGMKFWLDGDNLAYRVPNEAMTDDLRSEVILHKADLIAMLQKQSLDSESGIWRAPFPEENGGCLSSGQERLWLIERRIGASPLHNLHFRLLWKGSLDQELLARSLTDIVARHAALRTTFTELDGAPRAVISSATAVEPAHLDLRDQPAEARVSAAEAFILDHQLAPFDLGRGPLMQTAVVTLADDDHIILVTQHHLVSDGWSVGIFVNELGKCYRAHHLDQDVLLPDLPVRYSDYARWQRERRAEPAYQERLAWWKEHLTGLAALELPGGRRAHTDILAYRGVTQNFSVPSALAARLKELASSQHCTLYVVLLTAWAILLHRYTNQSDFAVGTLTSGRDRIELQSLIGFFTNTVVLRCDLSGNPSAVDAIARLRAETESALDREVQLADVVLNAVRHTNRTPLIQAAFIFENIPMPQIADSEIGINAMLDPGIDGSAQGTSKFDLALFIQESSDGIRGCLKYADAQFEPSAFQRLGEHFLTLLGNILLNPCEMVGKLGLVSPREQQQLLIEWNDTELWNE